jgi:hypothetical protein
MGGSNELRTLGFSCAQTMLTYDPGRCRTNPAQKYLPTPLEPLLSCGILDGGRMGSDGHDGRSNPT